MDAVGEQPAIPLPPLGQRDLLAELSGIAKSDPDRPFLISDDEDAEYTYFEVLNIAHAQAHLLEEVANVSEGDHMGIMMDNGSRWVFSWLASWILGAVDVGIDPGARGSVLKHKLEASDVAVLILDEELLSTVSDVLESCEQLRTIVIWPANDKVRPDIGTSIGTASLAVMPMAHVPMSADAGDDEIEDVAECPSHSFIREPTSLVSIRFTSGTTGPAKAATLTMSQITVWAALFAGVMDFRSDDRVFTAFPLHHHLASVMGVAASIYAGGSCVIAKKFSATRYWEICVNRGATLGHILQPVAKMLLNQPPSRYDRSHRVRRLYPGMPNPPFEARFNTTIQVAYALTEGSVLAYLPWSETAEETDVVGRPNPHYELRIVNDVDEEVARGASGEIVFRPHVPYSCMDEYFRDPGSTLRARRNMWFHTGDIGHIDADGLLHFSHRAGDTIRRRGVNVPAFHIEEGARELEGVLDAAAVGVPAEIGEYDIKLVLEVDPAHLPDPTYVMSELSAMLPPSMVPQMLELRDVLPRTSTHKIVKSELVAEDSSGLGSYLTSDLVPVSTRESANDL